MFLHELQTLCIFARTRPPEVRFLGGARGRPRCPLPSLAPCCIVLVYVDDVVADILSSLRPILLPNCARFSPLRLIVCLAVGCVFIFPSQVATGTGPSTLNVSIHDVFVCGGEPLAFF